MYFTYFGRVGDVGEDGMSKLHLIPVLEPTSKYGVQVPKVSVLYLTGNTHDYAKTPRNRPVPARR